MANKHVVWIDYVKCVCLILVVLYHSKDVWEPSLLTSLLSLCIPPFFMINGWLMLRKERAYNNLIRKAIRILLLTTVWAVFNGLSVQLYLGNDISITQIAGWVTSRSHDGYCHTLWFMDTLLILTLLCPILSFLLQKAKVGHRQVLLFCFLTVVTFIPKMGYHLHLSFLDGWMSYSIAYYIGGWLLFSNTIDLRKVRTYYLYLFAGISLFLQWGYVSLMLNDLSSVNHILGLVQDSVFSGYRSPFIMVSTFALLAAVCRYSMNINAVIHFIGSYSLGIYLLEGIARKVILYMCPFAGESVLIKALTTFVLATIITWVLTKNKITVNLVKL